MALLNIHFVSLDKHEISTAFLRPIISFITRHYCTFLYCKRNELKLENKMRKNCLSKSDQNLNFKWIKCCRCNRWIRKMKIFNGKKVKIFGSVALEIFFYIWDPLVFSRILPLNPFNTLFSHPYT